MSKYFIPRPETIEELKMQYRGYAMMHHPDRGGANEIMQEINAEYDTLFLKLKDVHKNKSGETYTSHQASSETADNFKELIAELMGMEDVVIEIIGCFVWVTGDTKPHKEKLKALKFQWHSKKKAWYLKPKDYQRRSRKDYDLEEIRTMYGTKGQVHSYGRVKLDTDK